MALRLRSIKQFGIKWSFYSDFFTFYPFSVNHTKPFYRKFVKITFITNLKCDFQYE